MDKSKFTVDPHLDNLAEFQRLTEQLPTLAEAAHHFFGGVTLDPSEYERKPEPDPKCAKCPSASPMNHSKVEPAPSAPAWVVAIICGLAPTFITLLLVAAGAGFYTMLHRDASFLYIMLFIVGVD
jgi:hypothetical protein